MVQRGRRIRQLKPIHCCCSIYLGKQVPLPIGILLPCDLAATTMEVRETVPRFHSRGSSLQRIKRSEGPRVLIRRRAGEMRVSALVGRRDSPGEGIPVPPM